MRCLTLATQFLPANTVTFISCPLPSAIQQQIEDFGIQLLTTPGISGRESTLSSSSELNSAYQCAHALDCIEILYSAGIEAVDILVIDHYLLSASYDKVMRQCCEHIMVIDDLANRKHDCDILLDQNLYKDLESRYDALVSDSCQMLLGPKYALLQEAFFTSSSTSRKDNHILVCFGGSDPLNLTERVVDVLLSLKPLPISADIVVGASYANVETLAKKAKLLDNTELHIACSYMPKLMKNAPVMFGAGGTMHWERAASGVAGIIITAADNQIETTRCLQERHCCWWLGKGEEVTDKEISKAIKFAISSPQKMRKLADNAASLVSDNKNPSFLMDTILNIVTR
jgi:UDP-2,4-diacetamido-2,4,6-trideoxy-beta-L-altropyranose hydrolase